MSLKDTLYALFRRYDRDRYRAVQQLMPNKTESWLDLGSGEGKLFELCKGGGRRVGVDASAELLARGAGKFAGSASFLRVDLEAPLPFRSASFDVVTCVSVLQYVDRVPDLFREVERVLRSGGRFIFEVPNFAAFYRRWEAVTGDVPCTSAIPIFRGGVKTQFTRALIEKDLLGGAGGRFEIESVRTAGIFSGVRDAWPSFLGSEFAYRLRKTGA